MTALQWYSRLCRIIDENRHPSEVKFQRARDRRLVKDAAGAAGRDVAAVERDVAVVTEDMDDDPGD